MNLFRVECKVMYVNCSGEVDQSKDNEKRVFEIHNFSNKKIMIIIEILLSINFNKEKKDFVVEFVRK